MLGKTWEKKHGMFKSPKYLQIKAIAVMYHLRLSK